MATISAQAHVRRLVRRSRRRSLKPGRIFDSARAKPDACAFCTFIGIVTKAQAPLSHSKESPFCDIGCFEFCNKS
jgi:hypothetical protein